MSLWIVSNRLPVSFNKELRTLQASSGGLVSAISGVKGLDHPKWAGYLDAEAIHHIKNDDMLYPVSVDPDLYDKYYNGFGNDVLWPLFHYETEFSRFTEPSWRAYRQVNDIFADELMKIVEGDDLVWIQDFHLFLLPQFLREKGFKGKIGFFLHIPFPSSEVFRQLPVRKEILRGVLSADLVGFHDYSYLRHFASSVYALLGHQAALNTIRVKDFACRLGVFPISIDAEQFGKDLMMDSVRHTEVKYGFDQKDKSIILGVDRLDYSKGLELKLLAYKEFLKKYPKMHGKIQLLQIAIPSRTEVPEYKRLRKKVENLVGSINGSFGRLDWVPVHYIFQSVSRDELIALYKNSEILFVSSKRDGMNLVSFEYIACQSEENPGQVLLSEFTGAAQLLPTAWHINPWNIEDTANKIFEALMSSKEERLARLKVLKQFVNSYSATIWAENFIKMLNEPTPKILKVPLLNRTEFFRQMSVAEGRQKILLLDYDGTCVPIAERPELAVPSIELLDDLRALCHRYDCEVIIVSGRPMSFLKETFKELPLSLASDHGAVFYDYRLHTTTKLIEKNQNWLPEVNKIMSDFVRMTPESFIEEKEYSVAWHFRQSPSEFAAHQARRMIGELEDALSNYPVQVIMGKKVVEVRAMKANKGEFFNWIRNSHLFAKNAFYFCMGDDLTDEDMFRALGDKGFSIKVGDGATEARFRILSQETVAEVLTLFLEESELNIIK